VGFKLILLSLLAMLVCSFLSVLLIASRSSASAAAEDDRCKSWRAYCETNSWVQSNCKQTCSSSQDCSSLSDSHRNCQKKGYKQWCTASAYAAWMKTNCAKLCCEAAAEDGSNNGAASTSSSTQQSGLSVSAVQGMLADMESKIFTKLQCQDGKKNGNEEGVDCGSVCGVMCPSDCSQLGWNFEIQDASAGKVCLAVAHTRNGNLVPSTSSLFSTQTGGESSLMGPIPAGNSDYFTTDDLQKDNEEMEQQQEEAEPTAQCFQGTYETAAQTCHKKGAELCAAETVSSLLSTKKFKQLGGCLWRTSKVWVNENSTSTVCSSKEAPFFNKGQVQCRRAKSWNRFACCARHTCQAGLSKDGSCPDTSLAGLRSVVQRLASALIDSQTEQRQNTRLSGQSGVTRIRQNKGQGSRPYHDSTFVDNSFLSIHNHVDYKHTLGMGEFCAVMNGVSFCTRHNDYKMRMPSTTSSEYHATEQVPYPDVPPAVLAQPTLQQQVAEMREWFSAFNRQDFSVRDYRKYFKPVISYMEVWWAAEDVGLEEPFDSDRHFIDASSIAELHQKNNFELNSGVPDPLENTAQLPSALLYMNGSRPVFGHWNYRIMTAPLNRDLPLNRFRVVDDLSSQLRSTPLNLTQLAEARAGRFQLNLADEDEWTAASDFGTNSQTLLEQLMSAIPGKDNFPGKLQDTSWQPGAVLDCTKDEPLNTAYYSRCFRAEQAGAMGRKLYNRGFSDPNFFAAMTSHPEVAPMERPEGAKSKPRPELRQRWTYAIPLEIIYTTPLLSWNPLDLPFSETCQENKGRYGSPSDPSRAFVTTCDKKAFAQTPLSFFSDEGPKIRDKESADTTKNAVGVYDKKGELHLVRQSGHWLILPKIEGVGAIRLRYPIAPVHEEGSTTWKELKALSDITFYEQRDTHKVLEREEGTVMLQLTTANSHEHTIYLKKWHVRNLYAGKTVRVTSSADYGHAHTLKLKWNEQTGYTFSNLSPDEPHGLVVL